MLEDLFTARVRQRIRNNSQGAVLEGLAEYLSARGYALSTVHQYVFAGEHFGNWLGRRNITRCVARQFVKTYLPVCRCKSPALRAEKTVRAALNRVLEMVGTDAASESDATPAVDVLQRYAKHLELVQGLAPATIHYRLRYTRIMVKRFRLRRLSDVKTWSVSRVRRFVVSEGQRYRSSSGQVLASSVRSFLRFLLLHRLIDRDLATAVPSFANWRLASLPETVGADELEQLIGRELLSDVVAWAMQRRRRILLEIVVNGVFL